MKGRILAGERRGLDREIQEAGFEVLTLVSDSKKVGGCKGGRCVARDEIVEESIQGIALIVSENHLTKCILVVIA